MAVDLSVRAKDFKDPELAKGLVEAIEKWGHDRAIDVSLNGGGYSE